MRRGFFVLAVASVAAAISGARAEAQQDPRASQAGGEFNAPAPSHQALFKMLMAAYADVLGTDEIAAWEHYLVFRVPPNLDDRTASPECRALWPRVGNEISLESFKATVLADFKAALAQSSTAPRTGTFLLRTWESFGRYDTARASFPLETINSKLIAPGAKIVVPRTPAGVLSPEELGRPQSTLGQRGYCPLAPAPGHGTLPLKGTVFSIGTAPVFELELHGQELLQEFPMERGTAEAFINANPDRLVAVEVLLDVGPIQLPGRAPARITAARVLDRNTGRVLHTIAGVAPSPTATTVASPVDDALAFSGNRALLLTLRDHPDFATADALLDATRVQVDAEQMAWRSIENGPPGDFRWNPKKRAFLYEWQSLIDSQPDLARGPLLDAFLRVDSDWSFVTRDPAWDPRFDAFVGVFLFSRDKIKDREPSFAAQELMPVYKRHLDMAVAKAPTKFSLMLPLAGFIYDFASKSLRVSAGDLLGPLPLEPEVALPQGARGRAVYSLFGVSRFATRSEPKSTNPGVVLGAPMSPTDKWRSFAVIGSSWHKIPLPGIIAFDRRLLVTAIPMEPAQAEPLVKAQRFSGGSSVLSARVYFDAERVDVGSTVIDRQRERAAVLIAKVQRIEVVTSDNRVVATIAAAALPGPVSAPTREPPTKPAPAISGPTQADKDTEYRKKMDQEEAERSRQISERLAQQVQKQQKCVAEASKINSNVASKAYQDAFAACMAK